MDLVIKVLIGLLCLLFVVMGGQLMLTPEGAAAQFGVTAQGLVGLSTLRGDMGGMFLACVVMMVMGLVRGETVWFLAVAVLMGLIALGRAVGFAMDGFAQATFVPFAVELIIIALMVVAHRRLGGAS